MFWIPTGSQLECDVRRSIRGFMEDIDVPEVDKTSHVSYGFYNEGKRLQYCPETPTMSNFQNSAMLGWNVAAADNARSDRS